ncbi:hypothetical protein TNCV_3340661 [Trichonephila clavipes]|nr:hypothetical protein TNCV_3340661 [Trichonephila clavipes]
MVSPSIVLSENFAELNSTVTCMVLKPNDRRTYSPCHDEFRWPRSDYVRQTQLCAVPKLRGCQKAGLWVLTVGTNLSRDPRGSPIIFSNILKTRKCKAIDQMFPDRWMVGDPQNSFWRVANSIYVEVFMDNGLNTPMCPYIPGNSALIYLRCQRTSPCLRDLYLMRIGHTGLLLFSLLRHFAHVLYLLHR